MTGTSNLRSNFRPRQLVPAILLVAFVGIASVDTGAGQSTNWAIFIMKVDGSQVRKLAQVDGCHDHSVPRFSHDGKRVAFDATAGGNAVRALYVVNVDGSGLEKLGGNARPDWSPDDKQVAFDRFPTGGAGEAYVQNLDGEGETLVTSGISPRWSPDASGLAVSDRANVRIIDLVSGESRSLFDHDFAEVFNGFSWSPDGKRLAVVVRPERGKSRELLLVDARGAAQGMTKRWRGEMGGHVSFSPDGKKLVFADALKMRIVDVEGDDQPRLLPGQAGTKNKHPCWSPDGQWIVFSSDRSGP